MQAEAVSWISSQVGQKLDFDQQYGFQCVDFFNFYYQHISGDNPYSDGYSVPGAKDLWNIANDRFTKIPDSNTLLPHLGDVAVYGAAWGAGYGHVEMVESIDANGCTFIGENEHGNPQEGVVRVYRTWAQMRGLLGVMRYNWPVPVPTVQVEVHPYIIEQITPKQVLVKKGIYQWGMTYDNFTAIEANPVRQLEKDEEITVVAICHHNIGYNYYLPDANNPTGYNVLDCNDVPPPPPPPPPAAPVTAPAAQKYTVKATIMYFGSNEDAQFKKNGIGTISPGSYYIFDIGDSVVYLGKDNMHAAYWINTKDNVVTAPKPAPKPVQTPALLPSEVKVGTANDTAWKASYKQFYGDGRSDKYQAIHQISFLDYDGKRGKDVIPKDQILPIPGTFEKDGVTFYRPRSGKDEYFSWWYGIPMFDDYGNPNLVKVTSTLENIELSIRDLPRIWIQDIKQIFAKKGK